MNKSDNEKREVLLRVENLCQYFRTGSTELKAVDGVSFDIYKGEVFGLVGESGCGKTTTGRSIIKLYKITSGDIYYRNTRIAAGTRSLEEQMRALRKEGRRTASALQKEGDAEAAKEERRKTAARLKELRHAIKRAKYDDEHCNHVYAAGKEAEVRAAYEEKLASCPEAKRDALRKEYKEQLRIASRERITNKIQMIFQDPIASLNPRMTVRDTIAEGLIIKGIRDKKYIDEQVYKMLDLVGLVPEHAGRYPHEFSGGQRQRIGIARALIMQPEFIVADEPISALDVSIRAQVLNLLQKLKRERGLTYLFISHDLSVMRFICDRIAVVHLGEIVELADTDTLYRHPLHPYTRALLSAIPVPNPEVEKKKKLLVYDPSMHDYSKEKPAFVQIEPGHYVLANGPELETYRERLAKQD